MRQGGKTETLSSQNYIVKAEVGAKSNTSKKGTAKCVQKQGLNFPR